MPLPSTRAIPDGWDDHHRPTATSTMTAACTITRKGALGALNPVTLQHAAASVTTIYRGRCRVQRDAARTDRTAPHGDQTVTVHDYLVAVEFDAAEVLVDDLVAIDEAVDSYLIGRVLRVTDITLGSNQWQRDFTCEDYEG